MLHVGWTLGRGPRLPVQREGPRWARQALRSRARACGERRTRGLAREGYALTRFKPRACGPRELARGEARVFRYARPPSRGEPPRPPFSATRLTRRLRVQRERLSARAPISANDCQRAGAHQRLRGSPRATDFAGRMCSAPAQVGRGQSVIPRADWPSRLAEQTVRVAGRGFGVCSVDSTVRCLRSSGRTRHSLSATGPCRRRRWQGGRGSSGTATSG
jgi:hypothetical protein